MRLALAQINSVVGDLDGNAARVVEWLERGPRSASADLVLFPELVVTGYPPEDLLLRPGFVRAARRAVDAIAKATHGITALVGAPHLDADLYNACFVLARRRGARHLPQALPAELRRLRRGPLLRAAATTSCCCASATCVVGPTICEDIWQPGPAGDRPRARGRAADREHLRLAVPRRQGPRARGDAARARARQLVLRRALQRRRRPGRADLRRPLGRARRRGRGARARGRASRRSCSSSTSTRSPRSARRLRDVRRRALARDRGRPSS